MLHVKFDYVFSPQATGRPQFDNPLFEILSAIRSTGSVTHAAAHLGLSYRHVWGTLKKWESVLDSELIVWERGKRARLSGFGEKLLFAEQRGKTRVLPRMANLVAEMEREFALAFDPDAHVIPVAASHDLALPRLKEHLAADAKLHLDLHFCGSLEAIAALSRGDCLLAGFHVSEERGAGTLTQKAFKGLLKPGKHKLINFLGRQQGLMMRPGNPKRIAGVRDLQRPEVRFVNRQPGSGTRLEIEQLLEREGISPAAVNGFDHVEPTHLAVAAAICSGLADTGLGIRAAAQEFGLEFLPLMREQYYFACLKEALDAMPIVRLRELLRRSEWQALLDDLPGYDSAAAGEVVALRQALPWYTFRTPKREHAQ